jgi:hypothetical protein
MRYKAFKSGGRVFARQMSLMSVQSVVGRL